MRDQGDRPPTVKDVVASPLFRDFVRYHVKRSAVRTDLSPVRLVRLVDRFGSRWSPAELRGAE